MALADGQALHSCRVDGEKGQLASVELKVVKIMHKMYTHLGYHAASCWLTSSAVRPPFLISEITLGSVP